MARGQQKIQSQQKAAERQQKLKKQQGHDQKTAAQKALTFICVVCKVSNKSSDPFLPNGSSSSWNREGRERELKKGRKKELKERKKDFLSRIKR